MKKIIAAIMVALLCIQISAFAETITKPITVPYDFTKVNADYDSSANGWSRTAPVEVGTGLKITDTPFGYNTPLGKKFSIKGEMKFGTGWNANYKLQIADNLFYRFVVENGGTAGLHYVKSDGTEVQLDFGTGRYIYNCVIKFEFDVNGDDIRIVADKYKLDGTADDVMEKTGKISDLLAAKGINEDYTINGAFLLRGKNEV